MPKTGLMAEEDSRSVSQNKNGATYRMVNVRMPIELVRALEAKAEAETRSVGGQLIHILKQALAEPVVTQDN